MDLKERISHILYSRKLDNTFQAIIRVSLLVFLTLSIVGCAHVNYVGDEFTPTNNVDVYYSEKAIQKNYDLIGHGLGSGFWVKNRKIQKKLIDEAKLKGADAILITGLGKSNVLIGTRLNADEKHMNVVFLKYR